MGHTPRQSSYGFQFLRLKKPFFEILLFGNILLYRDEMTDVSVCVGYRSDGLKLRVEASILSSVEHFSVPNLARKHRLPKVSVKGFIMRTRL